MKLQVENVAVRFGEVRALGGVGVQLGGGEVTVLAGPNGSGKSTLMSVLLGLIKPDEGLVTADGHLVCDPTRRSALWFRERLGYLPEAPAFSETLSGRQVMRFFAAARGLRRREVEPVLERVGLAHAAGRAVRGYSRGMRQRLGLGCAILHKPEFLILDEPTGGLDQQGLAVLWEVLDEWRSSGRLVLLSSHELALVERRAERIVVLVDGKVLAAGTPSELRAQSSLEPEVRMGPGLDEIYEDLIGGAQWDVSRAR
ncbi:MAG: ABC transporter ATP-binding protein [Proteobacteria bacterium]|nr:ABC transporter ATP-binding protein [Pseudomonadota bacterium]MCP4919817.1 ABC transporter ATP-binding protein [Pseudomonadota bacterium]